MSSPEWRTAAYVAEIDFLRRHVAARSPARIRRPRKSTVPVTERFWMAGHHVALTEIAELLGELRASDGNPADLLEVLLDVMLANFEMDLPESRWAVYAERPGDGGEAAGCAS